MSLSFLTITAKKMLAHNSLHSIDNLKPIIRQIAEKLTVSVEQYLHEREGIVMIYGTKQLKEYKLKTHDGIMGSIVDIYFQDTLWKMRYAVVQTDQNFKNRRVLIAASVMSNPDKNKRIIPVDLSHEQIANAPDVDSEEPISRYHEKSLSNYYGWPNYWKDVNELGYDFRTSHTAIEQATEPEPITDAAELAAPENPAMVSQEHEEDEGMIHVRSFTEVRGYTILGPQSPIGPLLDIIIDTDGWRIASFLTDPSGDAVGKHIAFAPEWIKDIQWKNKKITTRISQDALKNLKPVTKDTIDDFNHIGYIDLMDQSEK